MKISVPDFYMETNSCRYDCTCFNTEVSDRILNPDNIDERLRKFFWSVQFNPETHRWNRLNEELEEL